MIKSGDIVEWVYKDTNNPVVEDIMKKMIIKRHENQNWTIEKVDQRAVSTIKVIHEDYDVDMASIKPGDIIEWTYKSGKIVVENETLWSSVTESWCQIGSELVHTCIACDGETITWMNQKGTFNARVDDVWWCGDSRRWGKAIPRVKK